ncbi:MAG: rhodanese-like domain-containing protein [Chloroflexi bacterium]|nr:rhodanese-like domain-containing protein [Chloroflexota bacterium]
MQKRIARFLLIGFVIALGVFANACASAPSAPSGKSLPPEISVADAVAKRTAGAFILDVREQEEWNEFHVPNSKLIPLGTLASRVSELPRDKEIVVVCRSGNRSQSGRDILVKAGFTSVTSMAGGLMQWKSAGHPTVTGP